MRHTTSQLQSHRPPDIMTASARFSSHLSVRRPEQDRNRCQPYAWPGRAEASVRADSGIVRN